MATGPLGEVVKTLPPSSRRRWDSWMANQVDAKGIWFVDPPANAPAGRRVVMRFDPAARPDLASWVRSVVRQPEKQSRVAVEWRPFETTPPFLFLLCTVYRPAKMRVNVLCWAVDPPARAALEAIAISGVIGLSPGPEGSTDVAFITVGTNTMKEFLAKQPEPST